MHRQKTRYLKRTQRRRKYGPRIEVRDGNHLVLSLSNRTTVKKPVDPQLSELCKKESQRSLLPVDSSRQKKEKQKNLLEIFSFDNGITPLMVAVTSRMKDVVEMLLKNGADPSLFDDEGETPLIKAVKVQEMQIFEILWQFRNSSCAIDHADVKGMTVLHWAVKMQLDKCVQLLLRNKASVIMRDKNGWTPLMFAAAQGNCSIACHLLDAGSNLLSEDSNHLTAICIAFNKAMFPLARLLVSNLTVNEATQYIKRLLDKIQGLAELNLNQKSEEKSCSEMMTCLMFSVSLFTKLLAYKEVLYKQKVIARVLASCQKYLVNCNIVTLISFLCFYGCVDLLNKTCLADNQFVMQFLRAGGPDFVLKIASAHHQHQNKMICAVTYILPIMVISEVDTGKEWIKRHVKKLLPYIQSLNCSILKDHGSLFNQPLYEFGDLGPLLLMMDRFFTYFDTMCRESQEETISELLADEVRLREKREKKRVKRQLRRQQRQMDALSDGLGVLHEGGTLSVSSEDDMSCDDLDWDQRHFSDGEETPWAVPFKNNLQLECSDDADSSEKRKSWTEYYPVVPVPGNDHQWVTVANKRLGGKARIQSRASRKSPKIKKKKESKLKYNVKRSESKADANQKNKLKDQKSLVPLTAVSIFAAIKDNEGLQALLDVESFTPTVVWDRIPPRKTKQSEMAENECYKDKQTLASLLNGSFLSSSQTNGTAYSKQVIKNCCLQEPKDNLQNSVLKNEDKLVHKAIDDLETNCLNYPDLLPVPEANQNHNSTTNTSVSLNDPSKTSLPFFMPSIHFQLDWKPLTNSIKQKSMQLTKEPNEGIGTMGQQMDGLSGLFSRNSCNNFIMAMKRSSEMASIIHNHILNKPKSSLSVNNGFKKTYNFFKSGTAPFYTDRTIPTYDLSKLQGLPISRVNNLNIMKLRKSQNQPGRERANLSAVNGQTNAKVLPSASGSKRKFHMARFTKDPEFPSLLKAIDSEVVNFIQLNEMRKCFKQISQNPFLCNSVFGHDAFYYASCMSRDTRSILVSEFPIAFNTWPQRNNSCLSTRSSECPKMQKLDKPLLTDIGTIIKDTYDLVRSQPADGDKKGIWNRKFLSYRWKHLFALLPKLPPNKRCVVDGILLPEHLRMYNINPRQGHLIVLGLQADGTELAVKVYKSDECAIKCGILKQLIQPLKLDFNFLIQYRTVSLTKDLAFLSMNACECNVRQYIEWKLQQNSFDAHIASGLVWHMLKGLKSLHDNNILHGRLKPENLLIDSKGRLLLANYGFHHLCKHQSWSSNNGQTNNQKLEYEKCWQPSEILRSEQHKKYTSKSDIQVAGMVAHFIISGGHHPFGEDEEVILNIILNDWQLHQLSEEAGDIIAAMLSGVPTNRPDVQDIMKHPYFWSTSRRFEMLLNVGSHLALMSSSVLGLSEETRKNLLELIKILDSDKQFQEWKTLIDKSFIGELKKFFQYKNTLTGLILFIYNTWNRWNQICKKGKCLLQEPSCYFFQKFPKLFSAVYHHIKMSSLRHIIPYRTYY